MDFISPIFRCDFREFCVTLALRQIDDIFQSAGLKPGIIPSGRFISGDRRTRVEEYYSAIDWENREDAEKFLIAVGIVISQSYISQQAKDTVLEWCKNEGWVVDGYQIHLPDPKPEDNADLFRSQFPAGLPFGIPKPDFAITSESFRQLFKFELKSGIGIIEKNVYPNFDFQTFQSDYGINQETNYALRKGLMAMNQTDAEKTFFQNYARTFNMAENKVPLLIPQAWIRWHSLSKQALQARRSPQANDVYRLDFVAFWKNKRYAIHVDDISHYAVKQGNQWIADEANYSKSLDEDRKLLAEGWHVYRVSNWEMRDSQKVMEILSNLRCVIDF